MIVSTLLSILLFAALPPHGIDASRNRFSGRSFKSSISSKVQQKLLRTITASTIVGGAALINSPTLSSAESKGTLSTSAGDFLLNRAASADNSVYHPGITSADFYFPYWFDGDWRTNSVFDRIESPLGVEVLGGQPVYDRAIKDIKSALSYTTRFVALPSSSKQQGDSIERKVVCDRYFNVKDIARASMGANSVIDAPEMEKQYPNPAKKMGVLLAPQQSNGAVFKVQLSTTDRVQYEPNENQFAIMERTKQTIQQQQQEQADLQKKSIEGPQPKSPPALQKEIETITVYTRIGEQIIAKQRTAVFFSPLDPRYALAAAREPAVATNAIDVRFYTLTMSKI